MKDSASHPSEAQIYLRASARQSLQVGRAAQRAGSSICGFKILNVPHPIETRYSLDGTSKVCYNWQKILMRSSVNT